MTEGVTTALPERAAPADARPVVGRRSALSLMLEWVGLLGTIGVFLGGPLAAGSMIGTTILWPGVGWIAGPLIAWFAGAGFGAFVGGFIGVLVGGFLAAARR